MYRNSVRAHSRRRNAFGAKTLETRTVIQAVDQTSPPINTRSTIKPTLSPSQLPEDQSLPSVNEGQTPCHVAKSLLSSAIFILAPATWSRSPPPYARKAFLKSCELPGETQASRPRPDLTHFQLRAKRVLRRLTPDYHQRRTPRFPKRTRALTDAAAKISSEVYDYLIFRTPEGYKSANLEPPDYGRGEKYEPVPVAAPAAQGSMADPGQGMSPDRTFIAPAAAPRPKTKVALGAKKAAAKPTADPPYVTVPDTTPTDASSGGGADPDLQVTLGPSRRGKEKRQEAEVEEVLTLKRTKRSANTRSADLHEGLRERDALASTIVDQIRDKLTHTTTDLFSRARALEGVREKEVVPLQKQVSAAEQRIQELEKELAAAEDRAEKAEKKLGEAEARAERAEKAEKEAIGKMKDASSLARFICTDEAIAKEFLTVFINTEVGDKLTWVYGQWAFSSGCRAIEEQAETTF
nr:serine/arginine repetitive matrix protein 2-like [Ipomoea batatas]